MVLFHPGISPGQVVSPALVLVGSWPVLQQVVEVGLLHPWHRHPEGDKHCWECLGWREVGAGRKEDTHP